MEAVFDVLEPIAWLLRFLGMIVLGVAVSWFAFRAYNSEKGDSNVKVAAILAFAGLAAVGMVNLTAGAMAGYALGAGIALLVIGLRGSGSSDK